MSDTPHTTEILRAEGHQEPPRLLWDWPTRLFHWVLAGLFTAAFAVATLTPKHGTAFLAHMTLGLTLALAVLLRLFWGLVGSRPSRFGSFLFSPADLYRYLREAATGRDTPSPGHNPGSSYAAYAMLLIPLGLAATGIAQGQGMKWAEEVHEALAFGMVGVVALHILGLAWHALRHRDNLALSMFDGKREIPEDSAIPSSRSLSGIAFLALIGTWAASLAQGLDTQKRQITLPVLGTRIPLGEAEHPHATGQQERHRDDD